MPQLGVGIIPSGQLGTELTYITRRGFVPKCIVQIYQSSPTNALLMSHANAASGGVSPITVPVQGASMTQGGWTDYSGSFPSPQVIPGIYNAEFNLKALVVPVALLGMQSLVQVNETVIDRLEATMNDASNNAINLLATALFENSTNNQALIGFPLAISASGTYGGIARSTYTWWAAYSDVHSSPTNIPTRDTVLLDIINVTTNNGGERPTFGVCGPLTWHLLATDFVAQERYLIDSDGSYADNKFGARAAFQALMVGGVPIYFDPYMSASYADAEGTIYYLNENYISMYIHQDVSFGFTGFESVLPNSQIGYVGALLCLLELVCAKPSSCGVVSGYTYS